MHRMSDNSAPSTGEWRARGLKEGWSSIGLARLALLMVAHACPVLRCSIALFGKYCISFAVFLVACVLQPRVFSLDQFLTHAWLYAHAPAGFEQLDQYLQRAPSFTFFLLGRAGTALILATGVHLIRPVARYWRGCGRAVRATGDVGLRAAALRRCGSVVLCSFAISLTLFCVVDLFIRPAYSAWLPDPIAAQRAWLAHAPDWIRSRAWLENDTTTCVMLAPIYAIPLAIACIPAFVAPLFMRKSRERYSVCLQCGYDLRGTTTAVCSECGRRVDVSDDEFQDAC